jgi:hypothetical protein
VAPVTIPVSGCCGLTTPRFLKPASATATLSHQMVWWQRRFCPKVRSAVRRDQRIISRHNIVSGRSKDQNHDAVMRIGSEAPKRWTHSSNRHESLLGFRHLEPSSAPHHKRTNRAETVGPFSVLRSLCRTQNDAVRYNALPHEPPQGDQKLARQGHDHGLASTESVLSARSKPLR